MRVLVYRALGLGDFLTAVPAYRALARAFPAYDVCLAAPEPLRPLAGLTAAIDTFLPTAELAAPPWTGPPPDVVVNLHGRGPQSHGLLQALGARRLVAFASPEVATDGPAWRAEEHEVIRWCRLLEESGVPADPDELDLHLPGPAGNSPQHRGTTVLHPGATDVARRWPAGRFAAIAAALAEAGHHVVVTGVDAERPLALAVASAAGLPPERVLAGGLQLGDLAALVAQARLVICGDTGVAHLATAYRTPSVLLFGAMSPRLWGPPAGRRQHRVLWHGDLAGTPGTAGAPHPALLAIGVEEVLGAVSDVERNAVRLQQSL